MFTDFISFKNWATANGYSDKLSIDRIDNDDDYKPSNCKWSNRKEQGNNKRCNIIIEVEGKKLTLPQFCEKFGLIYNTTKRRYYCGDRTIERLTRPKFSK